MSILSRITKSSNVGKIIGDASTVARHAGFNPSQLAEADRFLSPVLGIGAPYTQPRTVYEYRDPNKPNPNIELIYDYFKNVKMGSLSTYLPGLDPMELGKAILTRAGYNPDIVYRYQSGPTGSFKILDLVKDYFQDPVKGIMNTYDFIKNGEYKEILSGFNIGKGDKDEVTGVIGPLENPFADKELTTLPPDIAKPMKTPPRPRGGFPVFNGWYDVNDIELWSSHLWDVSMIPHRLDDSTLIYPPTPPGVQEISIGKWNEGFIPVSSFEFTDDYVTPFGLELAYGGSLSIPESKPTVKNIRLSVLDVMKNGRRQWKDWMKEYKNFMVSDYRVTPYKHCCMEITLYTLNTHQGIMSKETYLAIPTNLDTSYAGNQYGIEEFMIDFSVVGEIEAV